MTVYWSCRVSRVMSFFESGIRGTSRGEARKIDYDMQPAAATILHCDTESGHNFCLCAFFFVNSKYESSIPFFLLGLIYSISSIGGRPLLKATL